jgi:hypothetical protein
VGLAVLAGVISKLGQIRAAGQSQQFGFDALGFGFGPGYLAGLSEGYIAGQQGLLGVGAVGQPLGGL